MAERTVTVRLRAEVAQAIAGVGAFGAAVRRTAVESAAASRVHQAEFQKIGRTSGLMALGIGAGFVLAERSIMSFDKQMSGVAAVSEASAAELGKLRDAAIAAGANTKLAGVSASEAASAEAELVRAGVSVSDVLGGALVGSLELASAGQLDFGDAATIAAQAMNVFGLSGGQVGHVADVLAAAANKSAADVGQLGEALRQGGLVASGANQGLEQTVGTLALFADHALIGSDAGTSLKTMLLQLQGPSSIARDLMKELGINVYDAQGNFLGMEQLAGQLQARLGGLSTAQRDAAISTIFGNDAARAARVLYEAGASGVADYVKAVDDQGAAARMAGKQMDNLSGDVENLGGALESAILKNGGSATGTLRLLTQGATGTVNAFGDLPGPLGAAAVGLVGITGAGLGVLGVAGTLIPRVREVRKALEAMGTAGHLANSGLGAVGRALPTLGIVATAAIGWKVAFDAINTTFEEMEGNLADLSRAADTELLAKFAGVGDSVADSFGGSAGAAASLRFFEDIAESNIGTAQRLRDAIAAQGGDVSKLDPILRRAATGAAQAAKDSEVAAAAVDRLGGAASGAADGLGDLGKRLDVDDATANLRDAMQGLADDFASGREEGESFVEFQGRLSAGLVSVVRNISATTDALVANGTITDDAASKNAFMVSSLQAVANQFPSLRGQISTYLATLGLIPPTANTKVTADTSQAEAAIRSLLSLIGNGWGALSRLQNAAKNPGGAKASTAAEKAAQDAAGRIFSSPITGRSSGGGGGGGGGKSKAEEAAEKAKKAAEDAFKQHHDIIEQQFKAGIVSTKVYFRSLDEQMARLKPWTSEWAALHNRKAEVTKDAAEKVAKVQADALERQRAAEDNQHAAGRMSTAKFRAILVKRFEDAKAIYGYWSDEAQAFYRQVTDLDDDAADKLKDAAEKAAKARDDALDRLNSALDEERSIRGQLAASTEAHRKRMAEIQSKYVADAQGVIDARRKQLGEWTSISERFVAGWANSVSALGRNVRAQSKAFDDWVTALAEARRRGVSEAVIQMLGLDEGPQALAQLRMFGSATQAQIDELNAAIAARQKQAGDQAAVEASSSVSAIGAQLKAMAEAHAAEVEAQTEEFLAEQRALNVELAQVGLDGGRSFGDAIAQGLMSSIPAIQAAARAAQAAMGAAGGTSGSTTVGGQTIGTGVQGIGSPGAQGGKLTGGQFVGGVLVPGTGIYTMPGGGIRMYAQGTPSVPADGPAYLHKGERVVSAVDNRQLVSAMQGAAPVVHNHISLILDGKELHPVVREAIRVMNTNAAISGVR